MAPQDESGRKRARVAHGPAVLAALLSGVALEDIAKAEHLSNKQVQRTLRTELRKRWIVPAQDYAKLQIARLETIAAPLKEKAKTGDLPAIDRLLRVLDRLDRYHGFNKLAALSLGSREDVRPKLMFKMGKATNNPGEGA